MKDNGSFAVFCFPPLKIPRQAGLVLCTDGFESVEVAPAGKMQNFNVNEYPFVICLLVTQ